MKLISYRRCSTQKQGESGLGLEAQDSAVFAYARQTQGEIVADYTEVETGKIADRPELQKAIAHAKRIGATLVIAKLDRLARNVHFISGLMESGAEFVCCDMPSANKLTIHIMAAVAEEEARMISKRTKEALAAAKARGVLLGGQNPRCRPPSTAAAARGGRACGKVIRDRYRDAREAIGRLLEAKATQREIVTALNEAGFRTSRGSLFCPSVVHNLIHMKD